MCAGASTEAMGSPTARAKFRLFSAGCVAAPLVACASADPAASTDPYATNHVAPSAVDSDPTTPSTAQSNAPITSPSSPSSSTPRVEGVAPDGETGSVPDVATGISPDATVPIASNDAAAPPGMVEPQPSLDVDSTPDPSTATSTDAGVLSSEPAEDAGNEVTSDVNGDASGSTADATCPHSGSVRYALNNPQTWPSEVVTLLTAAMDEAVYYYNCYSDLSHELTVNYNESVPTAEANVDGWMSFGSNRGYMVVATAMHEIGHTMGVGYAPWRELIDNGRWTGSAVSQLMAALPAEQRDPDMYSQRDYITADDLHFWPYGLNQASEHQSEWSLINHVRIVAAMRLDKDAFRSSR